MSEAEFFVLYLVGFVALLAYCDFKNRNASGAEVFAVAAVWPLSFLFLTVMGVYDWIKRRSAR